jgi:nucleoside-diphosphate-sugar epimerase
MAAMRVLVTGGAGLIGSPLSDTLLALPAGADGTFCYTFFKAVGLRWRKRQRRRRCRRA